ncbi:MAG: hypothetical protein ACRCXA_09485 [Peptostreptococcaceae bacterium]
MLILKSGFDKTNNNYSESNNSITISNDNLIKATRFILIDASKIDKKNNPLKITSQEQSKLSVNIIDDDINTMQNFYTSKHLTLLSEQEFRKIYDQFEENKDHELIYIVQAMYDYDLQMKLSDTHYIFSDGYIKKSGEFYQVFTKGIGANSENYFVKGTLSKNDIEYINEAYAESYSLNYSE